MGNCRTISRPSPLPNRLVRRCGVDSLFSLASVFITLLRHDFSPTPTQSLLPTCIFFNTTLALYYYLSTWAGRQGEYQALRRLTGKSLPLLQRLHHPCLPVLLYGFEHISAREKSSTLPPTKKEVFLSSLPDWNLDDQGILLVVSLGCGLLFLIFFRFWRITTMRLFYVSLSSSYW